MVSGKKNVTGGSILFLIARRTPEFIKHRIGKKDNTG